MQLKLIAGTWAKKRFAFGGALLKGSHPKTKRLFHAGLPMHVVIRSSKATGKRSLFASNAHIARILKAQSERHDIEIFALANAGNHIHMLLRAPTRDHLSRFLRAVTGRIAQLVLGNSSRKAVSLAKTALRDNAREAAGKTRFWDARPFSRIVSWGRDFKTVARYIGMNANEAVGLSRSAARQMFDQIQRALGQGLLPRTPRLVAAGFT